MLLCELWWIILVSITSAPIRTPGMIGLLRKRRPDHLVHPLSRKPLPHQERQGVGAAVVVAAGKGAGKEEVQHFLSRR